MASTNSENITSKVLASLKGTPYESSSLDILSGGTANFIYRATLSQPLDDGTKEVLVKHSEEYIANNPSFKITLARCRIEEECLRALSAFTIVGKADSIDPYNFLVRTPKFYHFDAGNNTQVQEYLESGSNLKSYALKTYAAGAGSDSEATKRQSIQLGKALGRWLRDFHDWAAQQPDLRAVVAENTELQLLKHTINFTWLLDRIKLFPSILSEVEGVFDEIRDATAAELKNESELQVIHGDFWSGNILLPSGPIQEGVDVPIFVIDWEMAQIGKRNLDVGQMIGELYQLKLYKDISAGLWMVQGFVDGYGAVSEEFAFRTAIQFGAHLVSFGTVVSGWGTPTQVENCARVGRDIIVYAWKKDRRWFEENDLGCLFGEVR
ncbi:kinase-like domain-containing protein [Hypoxylon trugodes]|uniref:kinase-like domain-containing protein n=1 Tax=Hypoxylon trugodes TaxID=326681 RepID=UPI0021A15AEB|nr:kinase-like domain-containing protein [Hypoxylon trugodes]KAI1384638.1 kinase-like domain-containing protein [Hypoxylon trugodes]